MSTATGKTVGFPLTHPITIRWPRVLAFGAGCFEQYTRDLATAAPQRVFVVVDPAMRRHADSLASHLPTSAVAIWSDVAGEPTIRTFAAACTAAAFAKPDLVIGIGGGSALDVAKLVAALWQSPDAIDNSFGIGKLAERTTQLVCVPTTAGTGSEVSPNAILLDERDKLKKGVVSPHLVPDAAYVDPTLTLTVPPAVTAATGMDALTHCVEAYANRLSHPLIDHYALEGVRLIASSLPAAVRDGRDLNARASVLLGSLYGGVCLGPVNTGAVHALAYPLGGEFHVPHGVSNSVLLPHVLEFNLPAAPERYADIAVALGCERAADELVTARRGLDRIRQLSTDVGVPQSLAGLNVPPDAVGRMADGAMTVTRLLDRNVRTVTRDDAVAIYQRAFL
jgi:alcohol dehydrogenase class IV